ncbi:MAG: shikimate dehydrogenase [Candidatus Omnitrophica bacterium]|nr:shikimate dehydrogenase [Candidatus Omnitrophota bacterium]
MTRLFGIIGYPITHSLSPAIHEAAFKALRVDALYSAFSVSPQDLPVILRALVLAGVDGLNVTIPLKEAVLPFLDRIDPTAKAIGAVNTLVIHKGRVSGYNTDAIGFRAALKELGWKFRPCEAVILGAGGSARAVAWELARVAGSRLVIANRHRRRAELLVRWLKRHHPSIRAEAIGLSRLQLEKAQLLVNATSVGMKPQDDMLLKPSLLHPGLTVYDLIYHRQTPLVREAKRHGCLAAGGTSMLLYQGAASFKLWWKRTPPLQVMRKALAKKLEGEAI